MSKSKVESVLLSEKLIMLKNYFDVSDFTGLSNISDQFFKICRLHILIFANFFKKHSHINNIKETIKKMCIDATNDHNQFKDWFSDNNNCKSHRLIALDFLILVLLRKNCAWSIGKFGIAKSGINQNANSCHPRLQVLQQ